MEPTAKSLMLDLLSAMEEADAPVAGLVSAAGVFGISGGSVRVALSRLTTAGLVECRRRGFYRIGARARALRDQVGTWRQIERRVRRWDGGWVGVCTASVSAVSREMSRALQLLGMRTLEPGLALRPDNLRGGVGEVRQSLVALGLEDLAVFRLTELDANRSELALGLWDTRRIERGYSDTLRRLDKASSALPKLSDREAARRSFVVGGDAIRLLIFDPLLPAELVDTQLRNELGRAMREFDRQGRVAWQRLLGRFQSAPFGVGEEVLANLGGEG